MIVKFSSILKVLNVPHRLVTGLSISFEVDVPDVEI